MFATRTNRRTLLVGTAIGAAMLGTRARTARPGFGRARPLPLEAVELLPSIWRDAVDANLRYLHALKPDRLLHNFRTSAGLPPRGERYGGWEGDTIAGHTLGHYLTAISLMHAQTGDAECRRRAAYIVGELAACQAAHGDGYVAGFTRKRGDVEEDGKALFPELMRGDIRALPFDLNGCWVPFYNWHKLFAGLFAAADHCGEAQALRVATGLGRYIDRVFAALDDAQVQHVLDCEHGGINESFAELHVRTRDPRWLRLAERLRHRKVLDGLTAHRDVLPWLHANTQIPKVIGLARLHEITGAASHAEAARFFWETVTRDYSYVIGGNADREHFPAPRSIARHITEQTCESCNSYNMLKLTRHLYGWRPEARLFDYYERAHLNHIMAQQDPASGMFAYMVPLMPGAAREFSKPFDDFWCCVGTGMESHAKHGDSAWWTTRDALIVNLYIPSVVAWKARGVAARLETGYPFAETVAITVEAAEPASFALALRIPGWCAGASLAVNGRPVSAAAAGDYAVIERRWRTGDRVELTLPMTLRAEPTPDDASTIALLHGPLVLAADLGPADAPFEGPAPALVAKDVLGGISPVDAAKGRYRADAIARPKPLDFSPFAGLRHRRTAVYFRAFDEAGWQAELAARAAEAAALRRLDARSIDRIDLGNADAEAAHGLVSKISYPVSYRARSGRDARGLGWFEFRMAVRPGAASLRATYWGEERDKSFDILIDGTKIATQTLDGSRPSAFFDCEYPIPPELGRGKTHIVVRFQPSDETTRCGPVYGVRLLAPDPDKPDGG